MIDQKTRTVTPQVQQLEQEPATPVVPAARSHGRPHVVIVGAGFGGLSAARALARADVAVTLLDRNNYHGFWPLLYQVATAGLEPESIAYPVRGIVRRYPHIEFQMFEVTGVDFDKRLVLNHGAPIQYDYLVLAAGSANNYFGNDQLATQTFGMKDINEAEQVRNHVLSCFERAVRESDPQRQAALLTFVVIGGGPTGVELSGAFAELIRHVLHKDYPMLEHLHPQVILLEAGTQLLTPFPETLRANAVATLTRMGVDVEFKSAVASVQGTIVTLRDGRTITADTVIWAAGVRGALLGDTLGIKLERGARVKVEPTLNLAAHPEVFVIGDMAHVDGYKGGPHPMLAQVAMQEGKYAARNIQAQIHGDVMAPFVYKDPGQMATIGRRAAVFDAFGVRLTGLLAWLGWLFIHLIYLIGFRNRAIVLLNWAYNYFTFGGGVRLISWTEHRPADQVIEE